MQNPPKKCLTSPMAAIWRIGRGHGQRPRHLASDRRPRNVATNAGRIRRDSRSRPRPSARVARLKIFFTFVNSLISAVNCKGANRPWPRRDNPHTGQPTPRRRHGHRPLGTPWPPVTRSTDHRDTMTAGHQARRDQWPAQNRRGHRPAPRNHSGHTAHGRVALGGWRAGALSAPCGSRSRGWSGSGVAG